MKRSSIVFKLIPIFLVTLWVATCSDEDPDPDTGTDSDSDTDTDTDTDTDSDTDSDTDTGGDMYGCQLVCDLIEECDPSWPGLSDCMGWCKNPDPWTVGPEPDDECFDKYTELNECIGALEACDGFQEYWVTAYYIVGYEYACEDKVIAMEQHCFSNSDCSPSAGDSTMCEETNCCGYSYDYDTITDCEGWTDQYGMNCSCAWTSGDEEHLVRCTGVPGEDPACWCD